MTAVAITARERSHKTEQWIVRVEGVSIVYVGEAEKAWRFGHKHILQCFDGAAHKRGKPCAC
jgi:hypothetical protein